MANSTIGIMFFGTPHQGLLNSASVDAMLGRSGSRETPCTISGELELWSRSLQSQSCRYEGIGQNYPTLCCYETSQSQTSQGRQVVSCLAHSVQFARMLTRDMFSAGREAFGCSSRSSKCHTFPAAETAPRVNKAGRTGRLGVAVPDRSHQTLDSSCSCANATGGREASKELPVSIMTARGRINVFIVRQGDILKLFRIQWSCVQ